MIFCARATRGFRKPSLDARSGRSISPHPWKNNERAWKGRLLSRSTRAIEDQPGHPYKPREKAAESLLDGQYALRSFALSFPSRLPIPSDIVPAEHTAILAFHLRAGWMSLPLRVSMDGDARQAGRAGRTKQGLNSTLRPHPHSARELVGALRAQRPYQRPRHPRRRPRVARAQKIISLHPLLLLSAVDPNPDSR